MRADIETLTTSYIVRLNEVVNQFLVVVRLVNTEYNEMNCLPGSSFITTHFILYLFADHQPFNLRVAKN